VLAPVLARLDALPGVACSRTEASGRFFLIELHPGADASLAEERSMAVLGRGCRRLGESESESQLAARGAGDPWLAAVEVVTLSFVEGRLLSVRITAAATRELDLSVEEQERLTEAVRVELFAALQRVHAEGGRPSSGWIYQDWPGIAAAAAERCRPWLGSERAEALARALPGLLAR
jgi:hypothetical protein